MRPSHHIAARSVAGAVGAAALMLTTLACGAEDEEAAGGPDAMGGMSGMDMSQYNEPDATPADQVDGAVTTGSFTVLDTAPPDSDSVSGQAWLAQNAGGTTVTVRLQGLEPGETYVSHLHEKACGDDDGGEHFKFDPDGTDVPPNEVHLGITADDEGVAEATVTNDREVGDAAPAVVVHPADAPDNRLACAEFS